MTTEPRLYDVVIFDSVGMPYTGSTLRHAGLGGSEFEFILLAEALARGGHSVLVLNNTLLPASEMGVDYVNQREALAGAFACRALVVARYSFVPPVRFDRLIVAASDLPGRAYDHLAPYFVGAARATLVAVSAWQRALFPPQWNALVIPNMLPDSVYSHEAKADPARFVYASAAIKGLRETVETWQEVKRSGALADAELLVCTPGYDAVDEAALRQAGVRFAGSLPFHQVVEQIAGSAGLFYVNRLPETFCIVAALAEALRRRVHILCLGEVGALRETVRSPLVTSNREDFIRSLVEAHSSAEDPRWCASPKDYREGTVFPAWLAVLGLDRTEAPGVAPARGKAPTVCLNMIVKNEAHVIRRCLESVRPFVSYWVVVDTGSSDGTQDIVRATMQGIPGELHERPWKDFGHNRTEAIELARGKADYLLVVDADDVLERRGEFTPAALTLDAYEVRVEDAGSAYYRTHIFRSDLDYRYKGVLHESLVSSGPRTAGRLDSLLYRRLGGGGRSRDPDKFRKDAAVLEEALRVDPGDARYAFYLAQSWRDAGELEKALAAYEVRAAMGGWAEEVWASLFAIAQLSERLGKSDAAVVSAFLRAHESRPQRAEALCCLARFLRLKSRFALAHVFAAAASQIQRPAADILWVDESAYTWRSLDEYAISSFYVGRHREAIAANERLLASPHLPESERDRVRKNMAFSAAVIGPAAAPKA
ncbi:MAG: glycosyltransferase [Polyangiaceae bacterium]